MYSILVSYPTMLSCLYAGCFGWPRFDQQASPSHHQSSSTSSSTRFRLPLPFSRTQHSLLYLPSRRQAWTQPAWTWMQHAKGTWCDHVEAVLQPLSQHHIDGRGGTWLSPMIPDSHPLFLSYARISENLLLYAPHSEVIKRVYFGINPGDSS